MCISSIWTRQSHCCGQGTRRPFWRARGWTVHFEQQCADAPTQVGGLVPLLLDKSKSVILDVGGNDTGARLIGGYAHLLKSADAYFVVNPYRPGRGRWSTSTGP